LVENCFQLPYVRLRPTINFARRGVPYRGSYCTASGAPDKALVTTFYQLISCSWPTLPRQASASLFSGRPEDVVPKGRADAVTGFVVLIMMAEVVLFQPEAHPISHGEMMRGIVDDVVANVAGGEPRPDCRGIPAEA